MSTVHSLRMQGPLLGRFFPDLVRRECAFLCKSKRDRTSPTTTHSHATVDRLQERRIANRTHGLWKFARNLVSANPFNDVSVITFFAAFTACYLFGWSAFWSFTANMVAVILLQQLVRDRVPGEIDRRLVQLARCSGGLPVRE